MAQRRTAVPAPRRPPAPTLALEPGPTPAAASDAGPTEAGPAGLAELLPAALDNLSDGVIVTDAAGNVVRFNGACDRALPLGLMDTPLAEWCEYGGFMRPDMQSPLPVDELPTLRALRGEVIEDCEIYLPGTRGPESRWVSVSSQPIIGAGGTVIGSVTSVKDITGRKQQSERHRLFAMIVEEVADAVLVTDVTGTIVYVNSAFERTTGFDRSEVLGENPRVLKSGLHSRNFYEELWARLIRGEVFRGTLIDRRKNGDLYLSSQTITPLRTPDGAVSHMVSVARDLTAQSDVGRAEDEARHALRQAGRPEVPPPPRTRAA